MATTFKRQYRLCITGWHGESKEKFRQYIGTVLPVRLMYITHLGFVRMPSSKDRIGDRVVGVTTLVKSPKKKPQMAFDATLCLCVCMAFLAQAVFSTNFFPEKGRKQDDEDNAKAINKRSKNIHNSFEMVCVNFRRWPGLLMVWRLLVAMAALIWYSQFVQSNWMECGMKCDIVLMILLLFSGCLSFGVNVVEEIRFPFGKTIVKTETPHLQKSMENFNIATRTKVRFVLHSKWIWTSDYCLINTNL